jgi:hypothetical protein
VKKVLIPLLFILGLGWCFSEGDERTQQTANFRESNAAPSSSSAFMDVETLQNALSKNGIGSMRKWRGDESGFISSSDYFTFGTQSSENGLQNNLAYYLESEKAQFVQQLKLMLNINNKAEKAKALAMYSRVVEKTFQSIQLEVPKGLLEACKTGKEFQSDLGHFSVTSELRKSNIDSWKLTLQSK